MKKQEQGWLADFLQGIIEGFFGFDSDDEKKRKRRKKSRDKAGS